MLGVLFAGLVVACGLGVRRVLGAPLGMAPVCGLAATAVLSTWCAALGAPSWLSSGVLVVLALIGVAVQLGDARRLGQARARGQAPEPLLVLGCAAAVPALLLGVAFAGVEAPVSAHDGAFHVEAIDSLRRGIATHTWYPIGFHASVAAVLGLAPGVDTARGTVEVAQGLAILAPLAVFAFGMELGLDAMGAAIAAAILGLSWVYPYDAQVWGGWPQAMGVLLLIGLWTAALAWTRQPSARCSALAGLFAGAIVISHGTEVYSAAIGLVLIAIARRRQLSAPRLVRSLPLALAVAALIAAPYLPTLLGWAGGGGAVGAGEQDVTTTLAQSDLTGAADWLQFLLGATGAALLVDLPVRVALIGLGLSRRSLRLAAAMWVAFVVLSVAVNLYSLAPIRAVYVVTFPWLVDHRPRQVAVVLASVLAAGGMRVGLQYLAGCRLRVAWGPVSWRRVTLAAALALGFFVEGSAISIYKRAAQAIDELSIYSPSDSLAMAWLKQHVRPGEMLANDQAADAGIWAPYKADVPILLPREAGEADLSARQSILTHVLDLSANPGADAEVCQLHVRYLYVGAQPYPYDPHLMPDRVALEGAADLEEVYSAGAAAVFRIHASCA